MASHSRAQPANSSPRPRSTEDPTSIHLRVQLGEFHTESPTRLALAFPHLFWQLLPCSPLRTRRHRPHTSRTASPHPTPPRPSVQPLGEGEGKTDLNCFSKKGTSRLMVNRVFALREFGEIGLRTRVCGVNPTLAGSRNGSLGEVEASASERRAEPARSGMRRSSPRC